MISVIVYGRNDAYGYNLHKRAAISLNCIAEMLSHPEDEILFVDYNTPNALPTFIEAIYDTLTPRAKSRLRVFRVRPELHARLADRTHVSALEPHSRNIALRRSNPLNRWVLFTNPDMIFIRRGGVRDLDSAVDDLPDGLYILPRFGLPEPVWEAFPRSDATAILQACKELGPKLHVDEITASHSYMPDFQLAPRQALFDIRGFDERMIHGGHAGANLCKRLNQFYGGRTESLALRLKGYHCEHTRVPELRADITLQNDFEEFVNRVDQPVAIGQDESWGAPGEPIEEVDFADGAQARFVLAMERALGGPQTVEYQSNAHDLRNFVYYQPEHALPYLAASLTTYPRDARFAYVGNNPRMLHLVVRSIAELGFTQPLRYGAAGTADLLSGYTLLIFDFGLDPNGLNLSAEPRVSDWPRELRYSLGNTARLLETCVEECQALWESQTQIPEFLVLNAQHHVFKKFVEQFLVTPETPYNTHVRKGWPRVGDERLYRSHAWKNTEECMRSFFGYETAESESDHLNASQTIDLTSLARSAAHKDGNWGLMDLTGTWTDGSDASILFSPPSPDEDLLAYVRIVEASAGPGLEPTRIQVLLEGEPIVRWVVGIRYAASSFKVLLPGRLMTRKSICRLTFHIEDSRESGVKVQRITFAPANRLHYHIGESVDFRDSGTGGFHLDECWTEPDEYGAWTLGPAASLDLFLVETVNSPVHAVFVVTDAAVNEDHPLMNVAVFVNQHEAGSWKLDNRGSTEFRILAPAEILREKNPVNISFRIETPRSPVELKWSANDMRPLGFRLTGVELRTADRIEQRGNPITAGLRRLRLAMRRGA